MNVNVADKVTIKLKPETALRIASNANSSQLGLPHTNTAEVGQEQSRINMKAKEKTGEKQINISMKEKRGNGWAATVAQ